MRQEDVSSVMLEGAAVQYKQCDGQPRSPRARSAPRALLPRRSGPAAAGARSPRRAGV